MERKKMTLREFCERYRRGEFLSNDFETQVTAGWYDWFCEDAELVERLANMWPILDGITSNFVLDNFRVWFKNCDEGRSDDIRFELIDATHWKKLRFNVSIFEGKTGQRFYIRTARNDFEIEADLNDVQSVVTFINRWEEALKDLSFYEEKERRDLPKLIERIESALQELNLSEKEKAELKKMLLDAYLDKRAGAARFEQTWILAYNMVDAMEKSGKIHVLDGTSLLSILYGIKERICVSDRQKILSAIETMKGENKQ